MKFALQVITGKGKLYIVSLHLITQHIGTFCLAPTFSQSNKRMISLLYYMVDHDLQYERGGRISELIALIGKEMRICDNYKGLLAQFERCMHMIKIRTCAIHQDTTSDTHYHCRDGDLQKRHSSAQLSRSKPKSSHYLPLQHGLIQEASLRYEHSKDQSIGFRDRCYMM